MTDQHCTGEDEETRKTEEAEGYPGKTCRKALSVFYATCKEQGLDYSKARPKKEAFSWAGSIKPIHGVTNLIRGRALHPIRTVHPEEWPQVREYLEEELQKSANSLSSKPLLLDHMTPLKGEVLGAEYEDGAIEYIAKLDDQDVLSKIQDGKIQHCSVEFEWKSLERVDGVAPKGINFTALSLLENLKPGDPKSSVELWEGIIKEWHPEAFTVQEVPIEKVPENLNLEEFLEYQLIKNRTVIFHGEVYESTCKEASRRLEYLASLNKKPIKVILNSVGGGVYDGLLVHDTIKSIVNNGIPVTCEARGLAASMGCILLQAGSRRQATENTRFLIHEVSSMAWGKASTIEEESEEIKKVNDMLKRILSEKTGKTPEEIEQVWHKKDVWMSAEEALQFGLIDEIVKEPPSLMESSQIRASLILQPVGVQAGPAPPKVGVESLEKNKEVLLERIWDRAYINDLPDGAFAIILSGGEKDETGKTVPRTLRKFPHHRADGSLDLPHLRNANARVPQSGLTDDQKREAQAHLDKHKKAAGIGAAAEEAKEPFKHAWKEQEEIEFQVAPEPTIDELIESVEDIVEQINVAIDQVNSRIDTLPKLVAGELKAQEAGQTLTPGTDGGVSQPGTAGPAKPGLGEALISPSTSEPPSLVVAVEKLEAVMPSLQAERSMTYGAQRLVQDLKRLIREAKEAEK